MPRGGGINGASALLVNRMLEKDENKGGYLEQKRESRVHG